MASFLKKKVKSQMLSLRIYTLHCYEEKLNSLQVQELGKVLLKTLCEYIDVYATHSETQFVVRTCSTIEYEKGKE